MIRLIDLPTPLDLKADVVFSNKILCTALNRKFVKILYLDNFQIFLHLFSSVQIKEEENG